MASPTPQYTRFNIASMPEPERERFFGALADMKRGPEWQSLVAIHGGGHPLSPGLIRNSVQRMWGTTTSWPLRRFCAHGVVTFLAWHRPYVAEFELVLQQYDPLQRGQGNADSLGLPYWHWDSGWSTLPSLFTTPTVTALLRTGVRQPIPNPLLYGLGKPSDAALLAGTAPSPLLVTARSPISMPDEQAKVAQAYDDNVYERIASLNGGRTYNLEGPHNDLHGYTGGDMSNPMRASWDPIFWLHHSNVERHHWEWIRLHSSAAVSPTVLDQPLWPFPPRAVFATTRSWNYNASGGASTLREWWDNATLSYVYDSVPAQPAVGPVPVAAAVAATSATPVRSLRTRRSTSTTPVRSSLASTVGVQPTLATAMRIGAPHVRTVRLLGLKDPARTSTLHVYVWRKSAGGDADTAPPLAIGSPTHVGSVTVFVGDRDSQCATCDERGREQDVSINITDGLLAQNIKVGDDVHIHAQWTTARGENAHDAVFSRAVLAWEETTVPREANADALADDRTRADAEEFARALGHDSVRQLQQAYEGAGAFHALIADNKWQEQSTRLMTEPRCANDADAAAVESLRSAFERVMRANAGAQVCTLTYEIDTKNVELTSGSARRAIDGAIGLWQAALDQYSIPLSLVRGTRGSSDLLFRWDFIDGPGTIAAWTFAEEGRVIVAFDSWIRWTESLTLRVAVHEIGHVLGLPHSLEPSSVMYPYENPDASPLVSENDVARVRHTLHHGQFASAGESTSTVDNSPHVASGSSSQAKRRRKRL